MEESQNLVLWFFYGLFLNSRFQLLSKLKNPRPLESILTYTFI